MLLVHSCLSRGSLVEHGANAVITRLDTCIKGLRTLTLNLAHCPTLSSQTILLLLDAVHTVCALGIITASFQLSWLHAKPYRRLEQRVHLSLAAAHHVQGPTYIQQLRAQRVHIHCMSPPMSSHAACLAGLLDSCTGAYPHLLTGQGHDSFSRLSFPDSGCTPNPSAFDHHLRGPGKGAPVPSRFGRA